jgi:MarR family 2-MHQ and catechol resistance regulon transcriptional repressor
MYIDVNIIDAGILLGDSGFLMSRGFQGTDQVWLVMMKAMRALTRYATAGVAETGVGLSDFGVLELLLHKGPLPVNTIGPIVDLTPGSISIAVDRLVAKGLVSRVESAEDRRVRIVALTPRGKDLIVSAFRKHSGQMRRVFSELSPEELHCLEVALKKVGKRASALNGQRGKETKATAGPKRGSTSLDGREQGWRKDRSPPIAARRTLSDE